MASSDDLAGGEPSSPPARTPGVFPLEMLDQSLIWVDVKGREKFICAMDEDEVLWAIDYSLANSGMLRTAWMLKYKKRYDENERARRWMLKRIVIRALLRRLIELEGDEDGERGQVYEAVPGPQRSLWNWRRPLDSQ